MKKLSIKTKLKVLISSGGMKLKKKNEVKLHFMKNLHFRDISKALIQILVEIG